MALKSSPPFVSALEAAEAAGRPGPAAGAGNGEREIPRPARRFSAAGQGKGAAILAAFLGELRRAFHRTPIARLRIRRDRRLRLRETLSLGERRLVAILECDRREYLVAATGQTVSLLAPLEPATAESGPGVAELRRATRAGR
jgi:hypothetical protein